MNWVRARVGDLRNRQAAPTAGAAVGEKRGWVRARRREATPTPPADPEFPDQQIWLKSAFQAPPGH
jgi:hypothetical protein